MRNRPAPDQPDNTAMRVVSYNIQFGTGKDGKVDLRRIAADIGDADIIAMQEVERFFSSSGNTDQVAELAALFPEHFHVYGAGVDVDAATLDDRGRRRQFGNMLLSRWPITSSRNHLLPKTNYIDQLALQRSALEGVINTPLGGIRVYSVHLGHVGAPERRAQIAALMSIIRNAPTDGGVISGRRLSNHWTADGVLPSMPAPAIILGDFNLTPDDDEYELLVGECDLKYGRLSTKRLLIDAWISAGSDAVGGHTDLGSSRGARRLDYAFLTPDLVEHLVSVSVDAQAQGSDHQPLEVIFE
jgi:endonuclease/exonuclease/phosphatase family metal-dependent hydrolase